MSASSAVSVTLGSITIMARAGSRAISRSVGLALGMPCDCQGFLPTNSASSQCSKSPVAKFPIIRSDTQNCPVFSWASALDRYFPPRARITEPE